MAMALSRKLMIEGEQVVHTMRTHVKVLFLPFLILVVVAAATGFLLSSVGDSGNGIPRWIIVVVAIVLLVWGVILPFLRWLTWSYTITNRRLIEQKGLLTRTGRVIPLNRINDVSFEKNLNDRILGCGTLVVHDASEQSGLRIDDIPHVEDVHRTLTNLIFEQGRKDPERNDESI
ncbi:MAG: hypothetical protein JWP10_1372 [Nocardioidaceae bacterium]|nr:hypothetical protein [Nocardioidaceae bacterium]